MHSGQIVAGLARHFNWFQNTMMTEWWIDYGQADLLFISRAGYVTEIEIKTSFSDWNADQFKEKWKRPRPHIARFFYAVPLALVDRIPAWIPEERGIISLEASKTRGYPIIRTVREAKRFKAQKISDNEILRMYASCYRRFWNNEIDRRNRKL